MQDTMYWPKGTSIKEATRPPVNLGSAKDSQATSIDVNMRLGCDHTDHVNVLPKDHHFNAVLWNEANAHISSEGIEISGEVKIEGYNF